MLGTTVMVRICANYTLENVLPSLINIGSESESQSVVSDSLQPHGL